MSPCYCTDLEPDDDPCDYCHELAVEDAYADLRS